MTIWVLVGSVLACFFLGGCNESGISVPPPNQQPDDVIFTATRQPSNTCPPVDFDFVGFALDDDGLVVSYMLDFGDGSAVSENPNVMHTYGTAGNYTATLTVRDDDDAFAVATAPVDATCNVTPAVSFSNDIVGLFISEGCTGCHGSAGGLTLTGTDLSIHTELTGPENPARVDTTTPAASLLLTKPLAGSGVFHGTSSNIKPFADTNDAAYQKILEWIQDGAPNN